MEGHINVQELKGKEGKPQQRCNVVSMTFLSSCWVLWSLPKKSWLKSIFLLFPSEQQIDPTFQVTCKAFCKNIHYGFKPMNDAGFNPFLSKEKLESILRASLPVTEPLHYPQDHHETWAEVSPPDGEITKTSSSLLQLHCEPIHHVPFRIIPCKRETARILGSLIQGVTKSNWKWNKITHKS